MSLANAIDRPVTDGKALVVLSGGQDSVTCLLWALHKYTTVSAVTFTYGQKHAVEVLVARAACQQLGITQHVVDLSHIEAVSSSALFKKSTQNVSGSHELQSDLPASFVPNRNAMMLTAAHALAQTIGYDTLVAGMCETDYSGYPDCRQEFILLLRDALNAGAARSVQIETPLMFLNKAETFALADALGSLDFVVENSHTCYNGVRTVRHAWGYGCADCPACELRARGWEVYSSVLNM